MSAASMIETEHLKQLVQTVTSVHSLPAVATIDWCERAASSLLQLEPSATVIVSIGAFGPAGEVLNLEATGGVIGAGTIGGREIINPPLTSSVRSLGWSLQGTTPGPRGALLRDTPAGRAWVETPAGRAWGTLGIQELVVAMAPLGHDSSPRSVVIEIGFPRGGRSPAANDAVLLGAVVPALACRALMAFGAETSDPMNRITQREQEVLELLTHGQTVKEIGVSLSRSPHTVHDHVKSLHRKLKASSRGELIARALGHIHENQTAEERPRFGFRSGAMLNADKGLLATA